MNGQLHQLHSTLQQTQEHLLKALEAVNNLQWNAAVYGEQYDNIQPFLEKLEHLHTKAWGLMLEAKRL